MSDPKFTSKPKSNLKVLNTGSDAAKERQVKQMKPTAVLIRAGSVEPVPIEWLWPGKIAVGKVTLIAGDPGLGKSLVTTDMAARVSTGKDWPVDNLPAPLGDVIMLSAEDDLADTIRPRLDAAGADVDRVHVLEAISEYDKTGELVRRSFNLKSDLIALEIALSKLNNCKLVIIDPISAYLGSTDSHNNAEIRSLLAPLADFAAKNRVAIVAVTHLNKGKGSALHRAMGSVAFVAAARAAYVVIKDPDDETRRLVLPTKNNLGKDVDGLAYRISEASNNSPKLDWETDPVVISADDILSNEDDSGKGRSVLEDACDWLRKLLSDGAIPSKEVYATALEAGYSKRTIERAKAQLNVESVKQSSSGKWVWELPKPIHRQDLPQDTGDVGDHTDKQRHTTVVDEEERQDRQPKNAGEDNVASTKF